LTWLDIGSFLGFTVAFLLIYRLVRQPRVAIRRRPRKPRSWRQNAVLLTAMITALSSLATSAVAFIRTDSDEKAPPPTGNCPESRWFEAPEEKS
jgi:hypothetical protein